MLTYSTGMSNVSRNAANAKNAVNSLEAKKRFLLNSQRNAGRIRKFLLGRQIRQINAMLPAARQKAIQLNKAAMNNLRRVRGY